MGFSADRADVRVVKVLLGTGLVACLGLMWTQRALVVDAYDQTDEPVAILHVGSLDLDVPMAAMFASPYLVEHAPDTRSLPTGATAQPASTASGPTPQIEGGWSQLTGTVSGPAGLVAGATVRIERDTAQGLATIDVQSDELGRWRLSGVLGGRYRVRGWLADLYAMNGSQVLFLNEGESATVDLSLGAVDYGAQLSFTHMGDIGLGLTGTVAVSVTTRRIAADGVVHVSGVAGAFVTLAPTAGVTALPAVAAADADGVARFVLRCHGVGSASAVVQYQNRRATFTLPNCVDLVTLPVDDPAGGEGASTAEEPATPIHQIAPVEVVLD